MGRLIRATVNTEEEEGELREKLEQLAASSPNIVAPPTAADKKKQPSSMLSRSGETSRFDLRADWSAVVLQG